MDSYFWQERFEAWEDEKLEQYLRELEREQVHESSLFGRLTQWEDEEDD